MGGLTAVWGTPAGFWSPLSVDWSQTQPLFPTAFAFCHVTLPSFCQELGYVSASLESRLVFDLLQPMNLAEVSDRVLQMPCALPLPQGGPRLQQAGRPGLASCTVTGHRHRAQSCERGPPTRPAADVHWGPKLFYGTKFGVVITPHKRNR